MEDASPLPLRSSRNTLMEDESSRQLQLGDVMNARSQGRWCARYAAPAKLAVTARNSTRLSAQPKRARTCSRCMATAVAESMSNDSTAVDEANAFAGGWDL